MSSKLKLACVAALALASIASPAFAQTATTAAHRHHYAHHPVYNSRADAGYRAYGAIGPAVNPVDDPALAGGGNPGYNACAGHARC